MPGSAIVALRTVSLDDKWALSRGRVVMNGTQAIARVMLAQKDLDQRRGLNTAGYITGYRGSPLGNVDTTLWSIGDRLAAANIRFQPGVNEDIAATAVRGTQQLDAVPNPRYDGVFAAWYGKGPGVDRSGDAFKHGNYVGAHRNGGVLVFYGDDHGGKSSTVAHQSEQAVAASLIPSLYPANVEEILRFGLLGIALSRFSGSWVGIKCVNEVAEQTATIDLDLDGFEIVVPERPADLPIGINIEQATYNPLREEQIVVEHRLPLVHAFVRANGIDRVVIDAPKRALGIVAAGKSYGDVRAALALLGLDEGAAAALGLSLYKVGCIWPLEPVGLIELAQGQDTLLVIEEKRSFLEQQIAATLVNIPGHPRIIGKADEDGAPLLSSIVQLDPSGLAIAIADRLDRLGLSNDAVRATRSRLAGAGQAVAAPLRRSPYFCSGCPHNRSTRVPDGSVSMTGIGCHTMVNFVRPDVALLPTQMGGEGGNWIGLAPFTDTPHIFQNMGDGTYYHSGLLAIRAAVASGVNITYKILYNDAVAMTGGQPVDGPISVAEIARQVQDEGVKTIILLSDDPSRHEGNRELPAGVEIGHRDTLDDVQKRLREVSGCTVLIYEQTCAAEKRRRRKTGAFPNPPKRLFIAPSVCEGCGDCSVQSTCVSLVPMETEFGRKRAIDQSSCNKDYSCLNGFCPSFVTVYDAEPRKPKALTIDEALFADLADAPRAMIGDAGYNVMITGIGGTGVVTVGALLGMAAHIEGLSMSLFDMTGLSQKNGAVYSHVRIAASHGAVHAQRLGRGEADLLLAFDLVAALGAEAAMTLSRVRTSAVVNGDVSPTLAFQFNRDFDPDTTLLTAQLRRAVDTDNFTGANASAIALAIMGDTIGANLFLLGVAAQGGKLPVGVEAIEQAVALNGVAVPFNIRAFRLGRLYAADPQAVLDMARGATPHQAPHADTVDEIIEHRAAHLTAYQNAALAQRYRDVMAQVRAVDAGIASGRDTLSRTVARTYAKLLAYKDEYEVARMLTDNRLRADIAKAFDDRARIAFNLAPPILGGGLVNGRPRKREFGSWILSPLRVLARLRGLRGTAFDPFGYTAERRMERGLIADYTQLLSATLAALMPANYDRAVALLAAADEIRGYGPVKEQAVAAYRTKLVELDAAFRETPIASDTPRPLVRAG
ncbi:indolepyruvate ferredoxin oxidoreductase family protein [Novosphingobium sp. G106]|nr:indolepyruvate ferredoxin oxidoreductase family protein [Novosphingobium sp. G106]